MKILKAHDVVALAYLAILSTIVLAVRPPGTALYLLGHAAAAAVVLGVHVGEARWGGSLWTVARYWYVFPFVLCAFRELHYLIPAVRPFDDARYDKILNALDQRLFGDVDAFCLGILSPVAADVLHLCYWSYYVALAILGARLHVAKEWGKLNEYVAVVLTSLLISYLGYFVVPALGPHVYYPSRPAVLDGWLLGGTMHKIVTTLELRMADAFPSGHTLMSLVLMFLAKRHFSAKTFWIVTPTAVGCILATVLLRYHYIVDVLASIALFPGCAWLGLRLTRWRSGPLDSASVDRRA